jgi:hypothetical protein
MVFVPASIWTDKDKVRPRTRHEGPEGEYRYICTLSLNSAIDGAGGQRHAQFLYVMS